MEEGQRAKTFLVESYVPRLDGPCAAAISSRFARAFDALRREGIAVQSFQSFAILDDETYLCLVAAHGREDVEQLIRRARLGNDHLVEVVEIDVSGRRSS